MVHTAKAIPFDEDTCSLRLVREWTALCLRCLSRSIIDFTRSSLNEVC